LPWLRQGDVFESVPYVHLEASGTLLRTVKEKNAAVLVSENCQIDKRTGKGLPRPGQRLLFLPLTDFQLAFDGNQRAKMLRGEVQPPEAILVGEYEGIHLAARLGDIFSLPAATFSPAPESFDDHPEADPTDPVHMTIDPDWVRLMTMEPEAVTIMHRKMWVFLTGFEQDALDRPRTP